MGFVITYLQLPVDQMSEWRITYVTHALFHFDLQSVFPNARMEELVIVHLTSRTLTATVPVGTQDPTASTMVGMHDQEHATCPSWCSLCKCLVLAAAATSLPSLVRQPQPTVFLLSCNRIVQ